MHVHCPQCHSPIELPSDGELSDIACPSCGSSLRHHLLPPRVVGPERTELCRHVHQRLSVVNRGAFLTLRTIPSLVRLPFASGAFALRVPALVVGHLGWFSGGIVSCAHALG